MLLKELSEDELENDSWDDFIYGSNGGTIFHKRKFLDYHENKFKDKERFLVFEKKSKIFGVIPLAIIKENGVLKAKSPYGGSYGGFIFREPLKYAESKEVVRLLKDYLLVNEVEEAYFTFPLSCCYRSYSNTFDFVMLEEGFELVNQDISSVVDLSRDIDTSMGSRPKRMLKKALKLGVMIENNVSVDEFYPLVEKTFAKHGVNATHTKDELQVLKKKFTEEVRFNVAYYNGVPVSGLGCFSMNNLVDCSFYIVGDSDYNFTQASSLLIYNTLLESKADGYLYFDFGTSTSNMKVRENIFEFKEGFGALGYFRSTYKWRA